MKEKMKEYDLRIKDSKYIDRIYIILGKTRFIKRSSGPSSCEPLWSAGSWPVW